MTVPRTGPLRVLHVIRSLAAQDGGPPQICAGLAGALAARGLRVTVATVEAAGAPPTVALAPGVDLQTFPCDGSQRYLKSTALHRWLHEHVRDYDIVHVHSLWQFPQFAAASACRMHRLPYVVLLNGMLDRSAVSFRSRALKHLYWVYRENRNLAHAAALHCGNRAEIQNSLHWIARFPKFILGNGVDAADIAALPPRGAFRTAHPDIGDRPLALVLSRLHPKKGLDRLLPLWQSLARRMPDLRLAVAGDGDPEYVAALDRRIADLGLSQNVIRVGQLAGAAKWQALVDADIFILPSHQEGFSMAITEALAAGCPPVVTDTCNFDDLEPAAPRPPCGIIIRGGDMAKFVQSVEALLNDPPRRSTLAAAGRALVAERFTWQALAGQLEQIYGRILAGERLPADPPS